MSFDSIPLCTAKAIATVPDVASLPTGVPEGSIRYVNDMDALYTYDGSAWTAAGGGGGGGTVTSVTFTGDGVVLSSTPSSAVTTSGTVTGTLNTQNANEVLAGPTTGADAAPTFRALVAADIPAGFVPTTRLISTTAPIIGGGDLSADRTLAMAASTNSVDGYLTAADHTTFAAKQAAGNYVTALTGDVTASGPGSAAATIPVGTVTDTKGSLANKPACMAVATTNQTLSGTPVIDGQATAAGSIPLLTGQTAPAENGPWVVAAGAWSRPTWYPSGGTVQAFQFITTLIRLGTTYQGTTWRMTTAGAITIDTTATTWVVTPLALSANTVTGVLPAANGGTGGTSGAVTTFTGDGGVLSNVASTGAVTATLTSAGAYRSLSNATGASAVPTYNFDQLGYQILAANTTLTSNSPCFNNISSGTPRTVTLPLASSCIGKSIYIYNNSVATTHIIASNVSDIINIHGTTNTGFSIGSAAGLFFMATSSGNWNVIMYSPFDASIGGFAPTAGGLLYGLSSNSATVAISLAGTAGQIPQSTGTTAPTWTSTPGSGTAFLSISTRKSISAGTTPTIAGGGTLGTGGTVVFVGTAHDESGQFTVTPGAGATAAVVTITFGNAAYSTAPNIAFSPASAGAGGIIAQAFVSSQTTTTFAITFGALVAATAYTFNYIVKQ